MIDAIDMVLNVITILWATACLFSGNAVGYEMEAIGDIGSTICYGDLGCFGKNNSFFRLNLFPASPDIISTMFRLFTRQNLRDTMFQMLRVDDIISIRNSNFDHSKPTKMVVHGYLSNGLVPWMLTMKDELLKAGDFNVILIDWEMGSGVGYNQATANARVVGAEIAKLITALKEQVGANPEDFHIIGHSLGAHIGGYAGERLLNLGRITGLDPAEPNFQYTDKRVRLDPTDAKFVDVIHTDGKSIALLGFGMIQPVGHVDYYPNGGVTQPGCSLINILFAQSTSNHVVCSHLRAYEYFIESINSACPFQGYRCQSYDDFKRGGCIPCSDGNCGFMGFHADRAKPPVETSNVKYFLDTGSSKPFCRFHYHIKVSFGNVSNSRTERGMLVMNLNGSNEQLGEKALTARYMDIEPGKTYGFVATSINDLGTVNNVTVSWHQSSSLFDWSLPKRPLGSIYIENLEIVNGESLVMVTLCGQNAAIEAGHTQYFTRKC